MSLLRVASSNVCDSIAMSKYMQYCAGSKPHTPVSELSSSGTSCTVALQLASDKHNAALLVLLES